jgi:hypothetical protein
MKGANDVNDMLGLRNRPPLLVAAQQSQGCRFLAGYSGILRHNGKGGDPCHCRIRSILADLLSTARAARTAARECGLTTLNPKG